MKSVLHVGICHFILGYFVTSETLYTETDFSDTSLSVDQDVLRVQLEIKIQFKPRRDIYEHGIIEIAMPHFTSGEGGRINGSDISYTSFINTGSLHVNMQWTEGTWDGSYPYADSFLTIKVNEGSTLLKGSFYEFIIFRQNGIKLYCGIGENDPDLKIRWGNSSLTTGWFGEWMSIQSSTQVGSGCTALNDCHGRGVCDFCKQTCVCYDGYGKDTDTITAGGTISVDCSERVCPYAKAFGDVPYSTDSAHQLAECSNNGICERTSGSCQCFPGFEGDACQRRSCPNDCSGHGQCLSMAELVNAAAAQPLTAAVTTYGFSAPVSAQSWDAESLQACVCDSRWTVGLGPGQTQTSEWFGPDCSLQHCSSGDDPETKVDETACFNKTAPGGRGVGEAGNLCHVDCSNRGICDYSTGECACFQGWYGSNCGAKVAFSN